MRRREFITLVGGVATTAWPLAVRGQQSNRMRRVGLLMGYLEGDAEGQTNLTAFRQGLQALGWIEDRNIQIDVRWGGADPDKARTLDSAIGGKWLELLKEIAPHVTRVAVILHPETPPNVGFLRAAEAAAPSFGVKVIALGAHSAAEIEDPVTKFAAEANGGLIIAPHAVTLVNRNVIIGLAARYRLPAVYGFRIFATSGGLLSYGTNPRDQFRRGASYVDRILKGEKPGDLPVQNPIEYQLVINLKTAKALGLDVPPLLQQRADELLE